jgi:hypothetical protein
MVSRARAIFAREVTLRLARLVVRGHLAANALRRSA